jgi:amidohydrolase
MGSNLRDGISISEVKQQIIERIDTNRCQLSELCLKIHSNPELGFQEVLASDWLSTYLERNGFSVGRGICELPTAFRATYGHGKPVIAILAEYDALPDLGHACGHNIIATAAVGAGVASKIAVDLFGGNILVIGTPAEELGGGKVIMVDKGAFKDVEIAIMVHPEAYDIATVEMRALQSLKVEFFGKETHAGISPDEGINALEAMIQSFNAINSLRQRLKNQGSIHGIINDGGKLANIIPAYSAGVFVIRAEDNDSLEKTKQLVLNCLNGVAIASGARLQYKWGMQWAAMRSNVTLARLFARNMQALGRNIRVSPPHRSGASTDLGNVSQLVPTIQALVAIIPEGIKMHTSEAALAAASERGLEGAMDAAKAMAMTVVDLIASPTEVMKIKKEFSKNNTKELLGL